MIEDLEEKLSGQKPITREELFELVSSWGRNDSISTYDDIMFAKCKPDECYPLENLDVSKIDDLSYVFRESPYNGDLSKWDVSNCKDMDRMFAYSKFNNDSLQDWNTFNVLNLDYMFYGSNFNGNVSNWNIYNCKSFESMFDTCPFDGDISKWNFNSNCHCYEILCNNENFRNKYNNENRLPRTTNKFLEWFEENKEKIKEINAPKQKVLDFFSFNEKEIEI